MDAGLLEMDCRQLRNRIAAGEVKSVDATKAVFDAIEKYDPVVGAYISIFAERALKQAEEIDKKIAAGKSIPIFAVSGLSAGTGLRYPAIAV